MWRVRHSVTSIWIFQAVGRSMKRLPAANLDCLFSSWVFTYCPSLYFKPRPSFLPSSSSLQSWSHTPNVLFIFPFLPAQRRGEVSYPFLVGSWKLLQPIDTEVNWAQPRLSILSSPCSSLTLYVIQYNHYKQTSSSILNGDASFCYSSILIV